MNDNETQTGKTPREGAVDAQAQAWLSYLYSGDDAEEGRASFRKWLNESERNRAAFQKAHDLWQSLTKTQGIEAGLPAQAEDAGAYSRNDKGARRFLSAFAMAGAAAAALALIVGVPALNPFHATGERAVYATATGQTRMVVLPDGSRATLGAETTLEIVFSSKERAVALAGGRAFFEVEPDPQAVFRVTAGETRVSVIGTQFEVAKRRDNISVSVREGRVAVGARAPRGAVSGPAGEMELYAGQRVVASLAGALGETVAFDPEKYLAWRDGHLSYTNARLGDVIADFNRRRADKILFADPALEDIIVTVAGDAAQIDQMLAGIAASEGLALERTPSGPVLSGNAD